ncbi:MAG: AmmeMemoRadiSam system radical SAM enzyme [Thermoproteota archaeon]|nr:MAG: AmmeMemoRadiSam system radical SAM enzyme [Candidatus Korarchaeota archaeon]
MEGIVFMLRGITIRNAPLYDSMGRDVVCKVCERRCRIPPSKRGFCGTKINIDGSLYTLVYGDLSAMESRPIEIKPFYHYWPGSSAMTISTWSCNFRCPWCQNWHLSRRLPDPSTATYVAPELVIERAKRAGDRGICVSFNEPTMLFEYSLDLFRLAKGEGMYCCFVSNGYMTEEALKMLCSSGMDGLKIDIKGGERAYKEFVGSADWRVPWRNAKLALTLGIHVEIVYLIVPGVNDSEEDITLAVEMHLRELGPDVPLHFTRYFPAHLYAEPPTPIEKLEYARNMAMEAGINFVYIGNVLGHEGENTYCPDCGKLLIKRFGPRVVEFHLTEEKECPRCGRHIPIRGELMA